MRGPWTDGPSSQAIEQWNALPRQSDIAAAVAEEREACAKVVDDYFSPGPDWTCHASNAIRSRANKEGT